MTRTLDDSRTTEVSDLGMGDLESFARHACSTNPAVGRDYERLAALLHPGLGDLRFLMERLTLALDRWRCRRERNAGARRSNVAVERRFAELRFWYGHIAQAEHGAHGAGLVPVLAYSSFLAASRQLGMMLEERG